MAGTDDISPDEKAELVAFLDGEVDAEVADRLEERISQSPEIRDEARALRESYDLLEFLPMPKTSKDFTRRTAIFVAHGVKDRSTKQPGRWSPRAMLALYCLGLVSAFVLGWCAVALLPDPNRSLIEDLPLIEQLPEYRASRDIEFLRALRDQQILDKADTNRLPDSSGSPEANRARFVGERGLR